MEVEIEAVFSELRELIEQYRLEIPGGRGRWPESIKTRFESLRLLGLSSKDISERSGLPYYTILNWVPAEHRRRPNHNRPGRRRAKFLPVRVHQMQSCDKEPVATASVTPPNQAAVNRTGTVTVTLPNGVRIEGATPEFLIQFLGRAPS